jgi:hypothetical protein
MGDPATLQRVLEASLLTERDPSSSPLGWNQTERPE